MHLNIARSHQVNAVATPLPDRRSLGACGWGVWTRFHAARTAHSAVATPRLGIYEMKCNQINGLRYETGGLKTRSCP